MRKYFIYQCMKCGDDVERSMKLKTGTKCVSCRMEDARQYANKKNNEKKKNKKT